MCRVQPWIIHHHLVPYTVKAFHKIQRNLRGNKEHRYFAIAVVTWGLILTFLLPDALRRVSFTLFIEQFPEHCSFLCLVFGNEKCDVALGVTLNAVAMCLRPACIFLT